MANGKVDNYEEVKRSLRKYSEGLDGSKCPLDLTCTVIFQPLREPADVALAYEFSIGLAKNAPFLSRKWLGFRHLDSWHAVYGDPRVSKDQIPRKIVDTLDHVVELADTLNAFKRVVTINQYPLSAISAFRNATREYLASKKIESERKTKDSPANTNIYLSALVGAQQNITSIRGDDQPRPVINFKQYDKFSQIKTVAKKK